jgi:DAK2 domain fusion protein YloV
MLYTFRGNGIIQLAQEENKSQGTVIRNAVAENEEEINFTYCTEFIVNRENDKDPLKLRAYLETIGDCVVVVDDEDIIKTHVHTNDPGLAIQKALTFGNLTKIKIENMREQHSNVKKTVKEKEKSPEYVPVDESVEFGFVAVAAGEGVKQLFLDLGVNCVVSGGQTMNPSTDNILKAVQAVPAKTVFVLPNNKNIIMAAEQTVRLADRKVIVLPTRTIPQGLSAMLAFDGTLGERENKNQMEEAMNNVTTGQLTFAARDSSFDGYNIKEGDILAMANGKITFVEKDLGEATVKLTKSLVNKNTSFVTLILGQDVSEEKAQEICNEITATLGDDIEISLINGGQPVYYFIISVE